MIVTLYRIVGVGLVVLLLLSCNFFAPRQGRLPAEVAEYGVARENALFLAGSQPRTLDPATTYGGPSGVVGAIFSGLVTLNANLKVEPDLAAGWEISQDGQVYTFYLRQNAVFHNGRPVTAHDVVYSWERALAPQTGSDTAATYLGDIVGANEAAAGDATAISGLQILDDHTLRVHLDAPKVYFLAKLTYPATFIVDRENVTEAGWEYRPNGTGPFQLEVWRDDEIIILSRHERYYRQPARLDHVVQLMGAGIPLSLYETDRIDMVSVGGSVLERVQDPNNPMFPELQTGVNMCTSYIGLNNQMAPFDDARVRQAFNYALDKERLIIALNRGNGLAASGILPPGMPGFSAEREGYRYDPARARALLAEAGYGNGADLPVLTYTAAGYGDPGPFVTAIITMWQENLGVTIQPLLLDPYIYLEELFAGNQGHLFTSGWCADYPDPENFLDILFHSQSQQNLAGFAQPEIDALLEAARVEADSESRLALYAEIEDRLVAEAPVVFVNHSLAAVLVKPYVENYRLTPIGVFQWHEISINR